eukprot:gene7835-4133_t
MPPRAATRARTRRVWYVAQEDALRRARARPVGHELPAYVPPKLLRREGRGAGTRVPPPPQSTRLA